MLPFELVSLVLFAVVTLALAFYFMLIMVFKPTVYTKLSRLIEQSSHRKLPREDRELSEPIESREPPQAQHAVNAGTEEKECPHYSGYLTTLPEGLPFPDECFGCRKVVQCLRIEPAQVIENFYVSSAYEQ